MRSTFAFFALFLSLDLTFLLLGIAYLHRSAGAPNGKLLKAGGFFGLLTAFLAWYNAVAGLLDDSNRYRRFTCFSVIKRIALIVYFSFFVIPVAHFPWSATGMERRSAKPEKATV